MDFLKSCDGLLHRDEFAGVAGEHLGDLERLREEPLDLPGPGDRQLVLLGQLVHTQDGDDVLQRLVVLKDLLDATGDLVVLSADDVLVHDPGGGIERIDGGVNAQLGNTSGQHSGGVQVSEGGCGGGISQVVGGHVDGLHGSDGTLCRRGNSLLHSTHVSSQGGLVTDGRWNTSQQGRHLRASLRESEDVVDEEQHVLTLLVTEVLGDGGEHGVPSVRLGHVVNELHDEHSLAHASTAEQADFAALHVRGEQVHDLDASYENLLLDAHLDELWRLGVNRQLLVCVDRAPLIDGVADDVDDSAQRLLAHRDGDGEAGVDDLLSTHETFRAVHGNGAHGVLSQMLRNLQDEPRLASLHVQGVQDLGEALVELHVDDGTNDGEHFAMVDRLSLRGGRILSDAGL